MGDISKIHYVVQVLNDRVLRIKYQLNEDEYTDHALKYQLNEDEYTDHALKYQLNEDEYTDHALKYQLNEDEYTDQAFKAAQKIPNHPVIQNIRK